MVQRPPLRNGHSSFCAFGTAPPRSATASLTSATSMAVGCGSRPVMPKRQHSVEASQPTPRASTSAYKASSCARKGCRLKLTGLAKPYLDEYWQVPYGNTYVWRRGEAAARPHDPLGLLEQRNLLARAR